jgi:oligosaccharide repeat unit polymerase
VVIIPLVGDLRGGSSGQGSALEKTLDGQGVTLDVVSNGIKFQDDTPKSVYGYYTFAPVLDYVSTNFISRSLFGTKEIRPQTEESAELGKSYADTISYLALWSNLYLSGQGLGSSYIIEPYIDFGIWGLILYSILLALLIRWMTNNFGRSYLQTFIIVLLTINIYALPRDTATGFVVAILQIQVVGLIGLAFLYERFINDYKDTKV